MSSDIPDWVRLACGRWGRQKRRVWTGSDGWYMDPRGEKQRHVDGYAESFMGRIKDERVAAGHSRFSQHWDEVFWGDGLEVQRAIVGMPEGASDALHVKYVWDPEFNLTPKRKADLLGLKERAYWESVGRAEFWIFARLDPSATKPDLPLRTGSGTKQVITATLPKVSPVDLDLTPLNRPKLSIAR